MFDRSYAGRSGEGDEFFMGTIMGAGTPGRACESDRAGGGGGMTGSLGDALGTRYSSAPSRYTQSWLRRFVSLKSSGGGGAFDRPVFALFCGGDVLNGCPASIGCGAGGRGPWAAAGDCLTIVATEETLRCVGVGLRISRDSVERLVVSERSFNCMAGDGLP